MTGYTTTPKYVDGYISPICMITLRDVHIISKSANDSLLKTYPCILKIKTSSPWLAYVSKVVNRKSFYHSEVEII